MTIIFIPVVGTSLVFAGRYIIQIFLGADVLLKSVLFNYTFFKSRYARRIDEVARERGDGGRGARD